MAGRARGLRYIAALVAMAAVASLARAAAAGQPAPEVSLGAQELREGRTSTELAPGVVHTRIVRGETSPRDVYTVDVAFVPVIREALALARELRQKGYSPRLQWARRAPDDPQLGPLGVGVRVGEFAAEADATALRNTLIAEGYTRARVVHTSEDGTPTTGPWVINILDVDLRRFRGTALPRLANDEMIDRELLSALAARTGALASINGGYFVIGDADGTPGDLAGVSVLDRQLVSEAVAGRTSLILDGPRADVARVDTALVATAGGARWPVDGRNREPGFIRACGGIGGDVPTERPLHDVTCIDPSELIEYRPTFGPTTEPGPGVEAVLDASGVVTQVRSPRGGPIPGDGSVLAGTGDADAWLRTHASPGTRVAVEPRVTIDGAPARPAGVVNGGPRLVDRDRSVITAAAEGFHHPDNPEFYYRFGVRRNPRTLAGVTARGHLLLVTVEGRKPGYSVGASFEESALLLRELGAVEGVNLDGGGSTGMTIGATLITRSSDATGERPIGDAVVLVSGR